MSIFQRIEPQELTLTLLLTAPSIFINKTVAGGAFEKNLVCLLHFLNSWISSVASLKINFGFQLTSCGWKSSSKLDFPKT